MDRIVDFVLLSSINVSSGIFPGPFGQAGETRLLSAEAMVL